VADAYRRAARFGAASSSLHAFVIGEWAHVPALQIHPDAVFPVVVAVDLEVDPDPLAPPGTRVFEVGAVRMKGSTLLSTYHSLVRRPFRPAKLHASESLDHAPPPHQVTDELAAFIGGSPVVGHNLRAFDALHLRGMGVTLSEDRLLDTLELARLLHPDWSRHALSVLCEAFGITDSAVQEWHRAAHDALACGELLQRLGDDVARRRGAFLAGFRALVPPNSVLDRVLLQPRGLGASPTLAWALDPAPTTLPPIMPAPPAGKPPSQSMLAAFQDNRDVLVELHDPVAAYAAHLPADRRSVVAVASRARLDHALAHLGTRRTCAYVLPDAEDLLCPTSMSAIIEATQDPHERLELFCLYQAAHNHEAGSLYPFRIPADPKTGEGARLARLRGVLERARCRHASGQSDRCAGLEAVRQAAASAEIILAPHRALLHSPVAIAGDLLVLDDAAELQLQFAEHLARRVSSTDGELLASQDPAVAESWTWIDARLRELVARLLTHPDDHERLPLHVVGHVLTGTPEGSSVAPSPVEALAMRGGAAAQLAEQLSALCTAATQAPPTSAHVHAHWVELWYEDTGRDERQLARWAICGLSAVLPDEFATRCWQPFSRHIVAGPSLTLGAQRATFLEHSLGLPGRLPLRRDERPRTQLYIPHPNVIAGAAFLRRRSWALQVGAFAFRWAHAQHETLLLTIANGAVREALSRALAGAHALLPHHQVLLPRDRGQEDLSLWSPVRLAERLADRTKPAVTVLAPWMRRTLVDTAVPCEALSPLRYLNQRDPLVAALLQVVALRQPSEGVYAAYLFPQALLELKARLRSPADRHILLDGSLLARASRDELLDALEDVADVRPLEDDLPLPDPDSPLSPARDAPPLEQFLDRFAHELDAVALPAGITVPDGDLELVLRTIWGTGQFNRFPGSAGGCYEHDVRQDDVVRAVLAGHDQLLVAATGAGKSLCFQLPAILLAEDARPKVTLVFSPLIALMRDQVDELHRKGIYSAILLNSTLSPAQRQEYLRGLARGDYSIVYLAPEQIWSPGLRRALETREIGLVALDEAHCLSQWGHDFRTDYFALKKWIDRRLCNSLPREFPILALTATARKTYEDRTGASESDAVSTVQDIVQKLGLRIAEDQVIMASTERSELDYEVIPIRPGPIQCPRCQATLDPVVGWTVCVACQTKHYISAVEVRRAVEQAKGLELTRLLTAAGPRGLADRWRRPPGQQQRGLIYCAYRDTTRQVAEALAARIPGLRGRIRYYHGGLDAATRDEVLWEFKGESPDSERCDLVVATTAFGMGIDVRRLGYVIHFDAPGSLEAYYQEAGRAGRDPEFRAARSQAARCILLYHPSDADKQRFLHRRTVVSSYQLEDVYEALRDLASASARARGVAREPDESNPAPEAISSSSAEHIMWQGDRFQSGGCEVLATARDVAARAGVDEESIGTILYYLEYHAQAAGKDVIERGETANRVWRLKWEIGYRDRLGQIRLRASSLRLVLVFLESDEWGLNEVTYTPVPIPDLADSLGLSIADAETELLNLVGRHLITYQSDGRIRWTSGSAAALTHLDAVKRDLIYLLTKVHADHQEGTFVHGAVVTIDLAALASELSLRALALDRFAHLLFMLSLKAMEPFRLLGHFTRAIRSEHPATYRLGLWSRRGQRSINDIVKDLFALLAATVERLARLEVGLDWRPFDIMHVEPDYHLRQLLHRRLLLLELAGVLEYRGDPAMGLAIRVTVHQPDVPADALTIDLSTLRLKETYDKHKRRILHHYLTDTRKAERHRHIEEYFRARRPVIEQIDPQFCATLLPEQERLVTVEQGYHLAEGGPGCGKTTTLVERVKHLVYRRHVPLDRIMVTAHYNSAVGWIAKELEVLQEDGTVALATTMNRFGERLFRHHRLRLLRPDGLPYFPREPGKVLGEEESRDELPLISTALQCVHASTWHPDVWPDDGLELPQLPQTYVPNDAVETLCLEAITALRQAGIFPGREITAHQIVEALADMSEPHYDASALYAVYVTYLRLMGEEGNYYTFDDQILFALAIVRSNPELRREYARFFEHILVDEFQDFTAAEAQLFLALCGQHASVLAFGDPDQDMRDEQGGVAQAFAELRTRESCGVVHRFSRSFRSTAEILAFVGWLRNFEEDPNDHREPFVPARDDSRGPKPSRVRVPTSGDRGQMPVDLLRAALRYIEALPEEDSGCVALIAANKKWLPALEDELINQKRSFSILDGKSHYQLPHVDHVLVYLRLIADPTADDDLKILLRRCMSPYLNDRQIRVLADLARRDTCSLFEVLHRPESRAEALDAAELASEQRTALDEHLSVLTAFDSASKVYDVLERIRTLPRGPIQILNELPSRKEEVEEALAPLEPHNVTAALARVSRHMLYLDEHRGNTKLVLTTTTHAKSTEFDTVLLLGADRLPKRRLYVGSTRAKRRLFLLCDGSRSGDAYGRILTQAPAILFG
jgi:superfamily II DNA helicase RecQ/superfamily I DNA/RNA helicase